MTSHEADEAEKCCIYTVSSLLRKVANYFIFLKGFVIVAQPSELVLKSKTHIEIASALKYFSTYGSGPSPPHGLLREGSDISLYRFEIVAALALVKLG